jgi:hypothetical protein
MEQRTFEGTWEEILLHSSELVGRRVRLTVLTYEAEHQSEAISNEGDLDEQDIVWLRTDASNLGCYEPYDWQPGELDDGIPVQHIPGQGLIITES